MLQPNNPQQGDGFMLDDPMFDTEGFESGDMPEDNLLDMIDEDLAPSFSRKKAQGPADNKGEAFEKQLERERLRAEASKEEALRLQGIIRGLEPLMPLIESYQKDEDFKKYVNNFGKEPEKPTFEIPEDFNLDITKAMRDPDSQDAKILNQYIDRKAEEKAEAKVKAYDSSKTAEQQKAAQAAKIAEQRALLKEKYGITDKAFDALVGYVNKKEFTFEDALLLSRMDSMSKKLGNNAKLEIARQMNRVQGLPDMGEGGAAVDNPADSLFDMMLKSDGGSGGGIF